MIHARPSSDPASHSGGCRRRATRSCDDGAADGEDRVPRARQAGAPLPVYAPRTSVAVVAQGVRSARRGGSRTAELRRRPRPAADCRVTTREARLGGACSGAHAALVTRGTRSELSVCAPQRLFDQALRLAGRCQLGDGALDPRCRTSGRAVSSGSGPASALSTIPGDLGRRDDVLGRRLDPTAPGARGDAGREERGATANLRSLGVSGRGIPRPGTRCDLPGSSGAVGRRAV
jgi:hypothetical protein